MPGLIIQKGNIGEHHRKSMRWKSSQSSGHSCLVRAPCSTWHLCYWLTFCTDPLMD